MTDGPEPGWIITLVHGTWGRGFFKLDKPTKTPRWFEDGSDFREQVNKTLSYWNLPPATFDVCKWSGSNSITARERAARQLADQLNSQRRSSPGARQLVIAHSHGGNVAVRAIEYLEDSKHPVLVTTLATPFIEIFPRVRTLLSTQYWFFVFNVLLGIVFLLMITGVVHLSFFQMQGVFAALGFGAFAVEKLFNRARKKTKRARFSNQLVRYTSHEGLKQNKADILILRGIDDEATLSIAAGALGRRLSSLNATVMEALDDNVRWIFLAVGVPMLAGLALPRAVIRPYVDNVVLPAGAILIGTIAIAALVFLISRVVGAMCLAVYGKELFMSSSNPQVSTNSTPDSVGPIAIHTLTRTDDYFSAGGFRHFIYNEPGCADYVVQWAMARVEGKVYCEFLDQRRGFEAGMQALRKRLHGEAS